MRLQLDLEQPFTWDEHRDRIARARSAMSGAKIDVLVVTSLQSLNYLFGIDKVTGGIFQCVLLPLVGDPITIAFKRTRVLFEQSPVLGEVWTWVDLEKAIDLVGSAFNAMHCGQRVGLESSHSALSPRTYFAMSERLVGCGATLIDASDLILGLRERKSPTEIAYLRRAAEILDISFLAGFDAMKRGSRECDVASASVGAAYSAGGEHSIFPPLIASGVNSFLFTHTAPSRRAFKAGEVVVHEAGASFNNYQVVGGQSVIFGQDPSIEQRDAYQIAREKVEAGCATAGPGVSGADVARAILAVGPNEDLSEPSGACLGYTTGLAFDNVWYEKFLLPHGGIDVLEPGMVVSVFGSVACSERNWTLCVDPILITDKGIERLTHIDSSEMRVVGV